MGDNKLALEAEEFVFHFWLFRCFCIVLTAPEGNSSNSNQANMAQDSKDRSRDKRGDCMLLAVLRCSWHWLEENVLAILYCNITL